MQELKITMLGSSGVGKTSLLTVMWDKLSDSIADVNLQLTPDEDSLIILREALETLKSSSQDTLKISGGLLSTAAPRSFSMDLARMGKAPCLRLHFQDYPGEWLENTATREQLQQVCKYINESTVVLVAIDTPALMEPPGMRGKWHDSVNIPSAILYQFQRAYQTLDSPRLVILVPVKCESYLKREEDIPILLSTLRQKYEKLLDFFKSENLLTKLAVVVAPVETMGNVEFNYIDDSELVNGQPKFFFRKVQSRAPYSPRNGEQPLRYLLRFVLKRHIDSKKWPFFDFIRKAFSQDASFEQAVQEFAKGCKNGVEGFKVLQGVHLL